MAVLPTILQPSMVAERVSRLRVINTTLQNLFGCQAGGSNVRPWPMRRGAYDIYDDTREVATARLPGATSGTVARNPVGTVNFTIPRSAERVPLLVEELNQLRLLGGPVSQNDALGERYVAEQERILKQRITNLREFQLAAMLRGSYTFTQSGDDLVHAFSGGNITVNFQVPAGNKTQLDMLGGGNLIGTTWSNAAAPIVTDLFEINAAFEQLVGRGLKHIHCSSVVWGYVIANTQVQNQAGSVNQVFDYIVKDDATEDFTARLKAVPWVQWHITDNGLNLNGTFTKLFADTAASFHVNIDADIVSYYECPEPVVERSGMAPVNRIGEYFWWDVTKDPVSYELHSRFNGLPTLKIPKAIAYGTVVF